MEQVCPKPETDGPRTNSSPQMCFAWSHCFLLYEIKSYYFFKILSFHLLKETAGSNEHICAKPASSGQDLKPNLIAVTTFP